MKIQRFLFWVVVSFIFPSCAYEHYPRDTYTTYHEEEKFTDIPMLSHNNPVQIFFPGEQLLPEPYIKVQMIDVIGNELTSTTKMLKKLETLAQQKGVDALILFSKNFFSETWGEEMVYTTTTQKISALGIKYIKNINYLDQVWKQKTIYAFDEKKNDYYKVAEVQLHANGNPQKISDIHSYEKLTRYWSKDFLVDQKNRAWKFYYDYTLKGETILRRRYAPDDLLILTCKIWSEKKRVQSIKISNFRNNIADGVIFFHYQNDRIHTKDIHSKELGHIRQQLFYDENGAPKEHIYTLISPDGKETPYLKVVFEKYSNNDLPFFLEKEKIIN